MGKWFLQVGAIALLLSSSLYAFSPYNIRCGTFGIWAEALYWKPTTGGPDWVQQFNGEFVSPFANPDLIPTTAEPPFVISTGYQRGTFKRHCICPDYNWGFRVGGEYTNRCFFTRFSGAYIHFRDSAKASGQLRPILPTNFINGALYPLLNFVDNVFNTSVPFIFIDALQLVGKGHACRKLDYWNLDWRFGQYLIQNCGCQFSFHGGVRYTDIRETLCVRIRNTVDAPVASLLPLSLDQKRRSEFTGAGPLVGIGGSSCLWCNFGVSGELSALAIIGSRRAVAKSREVINYVAVIVGDDPEQNTQTSTEEIKQAYRFDSCTAILPGLDFRLGINYCASWCCVKGLVEVGYELNHYWNALNAPEGVSGTIDSNNGRTVLRDVGFAGPYIMAKLAY